jgi:hypothetical protein
MHDPSTPLNWPHAKAQDPDKAIFAQPPKMQKFRQAFDLQ